jgi:Fanconi-associated nuclease 1
MVWIGYIYTRILGTLVHCLGLLKEYDYQVKILEALLGQERWRRGKRGEWHERLAIIKQTHLCKVQKNGLKQEVDMKLIAEARECVIAAIQDESIHIGLSSFLLLVPR